VNSAETASRKNQLSHEMRGESRPFGRLAAFLGLCRDRDGAVLLVFRKTIGTNGVTRLDDPFLC
ncbi:MAG TPA: hypothetical protein VLH17_06585, partial [Candidatus Binatia bacterium]|nr:hypothetical protein [Candidatus Binatia bacterium]